jgi:hypothetical protein
VHLPLMPFIILIIGTSQIGRKSDVADFLTSVI